MSDSFNPKRFELFEGAAPPGEATLTLNEARAIVAIADAMPNVEPGVVVLDGPAFIAWTNLRCAAMRRIAHWNKSNPTEKVT